MMIDFNDVLKFCGPQKLTCVLHLGAHLGQEGEAYANAGISPVWWVEALPSIHAQLKRKVTLFPDNHALLACIGDKDEEPVVFHTANNQGQSSSYLQLGTHARVHPEVKYVISTAMTTIRVDSLLKKEHIVLPAGGLLNIDLQGAEMKALKGMENLISLFRGIYVEVNRDELYVDCPLVEEMDAYLASFRFRPCKEHMTRFGWGDKLYVK